MRAPKKKRGNKAYTDTIWLHSGESNRNKEAEEAIAVYEKQFQ